MKTSYYDLKFSIHKASSLLFPFMLFGVMMSVLFVPLYNAFLTDILPASFVYYIQFWSVECFYVAFAMFLCQKLVGNLGIAPALTLGLYFSLFYEGGIRGSGSLGYMGYLATAVALAYTINYIIKGYSRFLQWVLKHIRSGLEKKLKDKSLDTALGILKGLEGGSDWFFFTMMFPMMGAVIVGVLAVKLIAEPFSAIGADFAAYIVTIPVGQLALAGLLIGLIVGFDLTGPLSMSLFVGLVSLVNAEGTEHAAMLMTIFAACLVTPTWMTLMVIAVTKGTKRKWPFDGDDVNFTITGPINAFFGNVRLTTVAPMVYALRDPVRVIPCYMLACGVAGILTAMFGKFNAYYIGNEYAAILADTEAFNQPYHALSSLKLTLGSGDIKGYLMLSVFLGAVLGTAALFGLRTVQYSRQIKRGKNPLVAYGEVSAETPDKPDPSQESAF